MATAVIAPVYRCTAAGPCHPEILGTFTLSLLLAAPVMSFAHRRAARRWTPFSAIDIDETGDLLVTGATTLIAVPGGGSHTAPRLAAALRHARRPAWTPAPHRRLPSRSRHGATGFVPSRAAGPAGPRAAFIDCRENPVPGEEG